METKTRNRRKKSPTFLSGLTLDNWREDLTGRVAWAQRDPMFREILAVLINSRSMAIHSHSPMTENCRLGRIEGYDKAIEVLELMGQPPEVAPITGEQAEFKKEMDDPLVFDHA